MSEFEKKAEEAVKEVEETFDELKVQAELAKEEAEEKEADLKDEVEASLDNAKQAFEEKKDDLKVQAELLREEAEEKTADFKDKAGAAWDNFRHDASGSVAGAASKVTELNEDFKKSEFGQAILGEDGKFDKEDIDRLTEKAKEAVSEAADKVKGLFAKDN